jgi:hypothetical protein
MQTKFHPLHRIAECKEALIADIAKNERIIELIDSRAVKAEKNKPGYIPGQGDSLIGLNIFPTLKIPDVKTIADVNIMVEFDNVGIHTNSTFSENRLIIWIMCHRDDILYQGINRIDEISYEIQKMIEGETKYGFNVLKIISNRTHLLNPKYTYREMIFKTNTLTHKAKGSK